MVRVATLLLGTARADVEGCGSRFARWPTHAKRLHEWGTRCVALLKRLQVLTLFEPIVDTGAVDGLVSSGVH